MWCPTCQSDVAAELQANHRRLACARCQTDLGHAAESLLERSVDPAPQVAEREARELLARWSTQARLELRQRRDDDVRNESTTNKSPVADTRREPGTRRFRLDLSHKLTGETASSMSNASTVSPAVNPPTVARSRPFASWGTAVGTLLAYAGVALLTCGTALVVWSSYGGPANYAANGWLLSALGQMLLLLGVVTLISTGMEHTSSTMTRQIEQIGEQLVRIEAAHQQSGLRGPHYLRRRQRRRPLESHEDDGEAFVSH